MASKKSKPVEPDIEETQDITEETVTEVTPPTQKETADKGGFSVYLGPSIRGVIQSGMVFNGSKDKAIASFAAAVEKHPLIAKLIVPGETLAEDRVKVKTAGNLLNVQYNKLLASLKSQ